MALTAPLHWAVENLKVQKPGAQGAMGKRDFKEGKGIWPLRSPPATREMDPTPVEKPKNKSDQSQTLLYKIKSVCMHFLPRKRLPGFSLLCVFFFF